MSFNLPLTQDDRNNLVDTKENSQDLIKQVEESSITISTEIAKLLLIDTPFKKQLDPTHVDIFCYEEELRYLDGTSILQPLQEAGFTVFSMSDSTRLYINDGRFRVTEDNVEVMNVPLYPVRGYSRSQVVAGTNFDIWSRDRFGSTTSIKNTNTVFTINDTHKNLAASFDGETFEIDLSNLVSIIQTDETLIAVTEGTETDVTFEFSPVTSGTESIRLLTNEQVVTLVRDTDYTIDWTTGLVKFLKDVPAGYDITASYQDADTYLQVDEILIQTTSGFETQAYLHQPPASDRSEILYLILRAYTKNLIRNTDYTINYTTGDVHFLTQVLSDAEMIVSYHNEVQVEAAALASTIQLLFQTFPVLANAACVYNANIQTFTLVSYHGGPTSTVEVVDASDNDIREMIGFTSEQYMITGKYQNNLLNVEIDGEAAEIKIADFRRCFEDEDNDRGFNNDDMGFDWSGSMNSPLGYIGRDRLGPLFCAADNNGKDIAKSIEAQLRIVGSGGFKDASVKYYTDSKTFMIFSGTMGEASSVHVLPASDPLRDARSFIGYVFASEQERETNERGKEKYFETLEKIFNEINRVNEDTSKVYPIIAYQLKNNNFLSHSVLYTKPDGVNISPDFQDFDATTTKIYDDGSRGLPRLYPNGKLVVDDTNDKICFFEVLNVEKYALIPHGTYDSEAAVAEIIQDTLNSFSSNSAVEYTCTYTQQKRFVISVSPTTGDDLPAGYIFSLLWNSGMYALSSIGNYLGFDVRVDKTGSSTYTSDFQVTFQMKDYFNPVFVNQFDGIPRVPDHTVDEQSALLREEVFLQQEQAFYLSKLQNMTTYDNEVIIESWQQMAALELDKVDQEYNAIRYHRGAYANHISESDANIVQKTAAYNSVIPNRTNLIVNLSHHADLLNVTPSSKTYNAGTDFTDGGVEVLSLSVLVGLYDTKIYQKPAPLVRYTSDVKHIPGKFTPQKLMTNFASYVPSPLPAFTISANPNTQGYTYSTPDTDGYNILHSEDTVATIISSNSGPYNFSAGDTLSMRIDGTGFQTATFNATPGYTESRVAITNQFVIRTGVNDKIDFHENPSSELTVTLPAGAYDGTNLASQIQSALNAAGDSTYTIFYNSDRFWFYSDGSGGTGIFSLLWATGTNATTSLRFILGFDSVDLTGTLGYSSDYDTIFPVTTGVNNTFNISIDGVSCANPIVIPQGLYTIASIISEMTAQIASDSNFNISDFTITYPANKIRITSTKLGNASIVNVYEGARDFLRTVALDGDVPVYGGSDVLDIDNVSVDEVVAVLNAEISGISASNDVNRVRITTISQLGSVSSVEIIGGSCRTIIGFNLENISGVDQDNKLKVDIDGDTTKDYVLIPSSPTPISGATMASNIQPLLRSIGTGGYSLAECTFNETTVFQTFTNALRIISGTFGATSEVFVSDKTIKITPSISVIAFEENPGVPLYATITAGFYNLSTLVVEIKNCLEAVGANTYTVFYSSGKIEISSSGSFFSLLFGTLPYVATTLGFYKTNHTGSLSYTSDGFVKWGSCSSELGFDAQISEPGHVLYSARLSVTDTNFVSRIYWSDHGGGDRLDLNVDMTVAPTNTITGLIEEIITDPSYVVGYSPAFLLGRVIDPFRVEHNDTLEITANGGTTQVLTLTAQPATITSGFNPVTRIQSGVLNLTMNYYGLSTPFSFSINIDEQLTPTDIAAKIQQEVRATTHLNVAFQSALSFFKCEVDALGRYVLTSGFGGTMSGIVINETQTSIDLKLTGAAVGSGNISNSCNLSASDLVDLLNDTDIFSGFVASIETFDLITNCLKLTSTISDKTSRIQVSGSLADKLGFEIGNNNESFPFEDLDTANSTSLRNVSSEEIKSPVPPVAVTRGWDASKGEVVIFYQTIDDSKIEIRDQVITTRLQGTTELPSIDDRKDQITTRVSQINSALTPGLYTLRKDQVKIRLNKKTGSYIKVGDKLNQQDNNQNMINTNNELISNINAIL
jgi:hypothetical protein